MQGLLRINFSNNSNGPITLRKKCDGECSVREAQYGSIHIAFNPIVRVINIAVADPYPTKTPA